MLDRISGFTGLPSGNKRPRLHDVDLTLHIRPFNILIALAKHALDRVRRTHQSTYHIIRQHHPIAFDRHLFHTTIFVKRQQTILSRARQHLDRIRAWSKKYLLRDALPFNHLNAQTTLRADVNHTFVVVVERIGADHHARAFRVDSLLDQHRHVDHRMSHRRTFARFIGFEIPQRRPNLLYRIYQLLFAAHVWDRRVKTGATEV